MFLWSLRDVMGAELTEPELLHECLGHEGRVTDLAYTPGGERLVSASEDTTLRVWEPNIGQSLVVLDSHKSPVVAVAFDGRGERLASVDEQGGITIHETKVHELAVSARRRVTEAGGLRIAPLLDELGEMGVVPEVRDVLFGNFERTADVAKALGRSAGLLPTPAREHSEGWRVVREPERSMEEYLAAYERVLRACDQAPEESLYRRTKAVAELRLGRWVDCLTTLDGLASEAREARPEELAVRSMALVYLMELDQAQLVFEDMEQKLEDPFWAADPWALRFHEEARSLLEEHALR